MTTPRNHETVAAQAQEWRYKVQTETLGAPTTEHDFGFWDDERVAAFVVSHAPPTVPPTPALSPFDAFQIMKLRRLLEAQSQFNSLGPVFMAELAAVKDYLEFIGRGSVVPALERYEYERVAGAVLGSPGGGGLPDECLVCFAGRGNRREGEGKNEPCT